MKTCGIICEYNPLHLGHQKQITQIRAMLGEGTAIVCLMSGSFVQRGAPAIVDKMRRARAAVLAGADLVLELPIPAALSSAENFAAQGVRILSPFCDSLCFGAETGDRETLLRTAQALLSREFREALRVWLDKGLSFPAARQAALEAMGVSGALLTSPNDILAVEYCKAILAQDSPMTPLPICREGSYHDHRPDPENPSATALRTLLLSRGDWRRYVPEAARTCFENAPLHTLEAGERAVLGRLRAMTDAEFEALPYGSEGLWRKFMHAARQEATVEDILTAAKSKRYTRTRLQRMLLCACLELTEEALAAPAPYVRVLALNNRGRAVLKKARVSGQFPNIGEARDGPYWALEQRAGDWYGLFGETAPERPGQEAAYRLFYLDT